MRVQHLMVFALATSLVACSPAAESAPANDAAAPAGGGQENVVDDQSTPDIVKVAVGSPDHTTLVAALKAADLVTSLANAGPFTVFAPTNAAFEKLPAGTVETLLKPENKNTLIDVLYHHVTTSALDVGDFADGDMVDMADNTKAQVKKVDNEMWIGGAKVVGSVRASNGWVHVVDGVILRDTK